MSFTAEQVTELASSLEVLAHFSPTDEWRNTLNLAAVALRKHSAILSAGPAIEEIQLSHALADADPALAWTAEMQLMHSHRGALLAILATPAGEPEARKGESR